MLIFDFFDYTYHAVGTVFTYPTTYNWNRYNHFYMRVYDVNGVNSKVKVCVNLLCVTPVYTYLLNTATQNNNVFLFSTY